MSTHALRIAAFFHYMAERANIAARKDAGLPRPWTDDPILDEWKFTNVKREWDYTTRWMREHWTGPNQDRPHGEILFNCALFRYFGTVEFAAAVGWQRDWAPDTVAALAADRLARKLPVFTGAYIVSNNGISAPKQDVVCHHYLTSLWERSDELVRIAHNTKRWERVAWLMRRIIGFGGKGFMLKETLLDAMQSPVLWDVVDRDTWCPSGPGARRGLNRIFGRPVEFDPGEGRALHDMRLLFKEAANHPLPESILPLELHDIQWNLCEFDKYERVRLGEGKPRSRYKPRSLTDPL